MAKPLPSSSGRFQSFPGRRNRRFSIRCSPCHTTPCYLTCAAECVAASASVHNISAIGVGIVGSPWIAPGTLVHLELFNAGYTFALALDMRVSRVEAASTGGHYLGGQFTRKLTYDELLPFLT